MPHSGLFDLFSFLLLQITFYSQTPFSSSPRSQVLIRCLLPPHPPCLKLSNPFSKPFVADVRSRSKVKIRLWLGMTDVEIPLLLPATTVGTGVSLWSLDYLNKASLHIMPFLDKECRAGRSLLSLWGWSLSIANIALSSSPSSHPAAAWNEVRFQLYFSQRKPVLDPSHCCDPSRLNLSTARPSSSVLMLTFALTSPNSFPPSSYQCWLSDALQRTVISAFLQINNKVFQFPLVEDNSPILPCDRKTH